MEKKTINFEGKRALVTGASRGLGKDIALALAAQGAKVAICGRKQENLEKAAGTFQTEGLEVKTFSAHIAKSDQVQALFKFIKDQFGGLDILVNNVGMNLLTPSVLEADEGLWDKIIESNLKGTFLVSREAVKLLRSAGGGKIVNISSIAARKATRGMGIYCVAKAGIEMLTKVLAMELASDHINVNVVAPCMVRTPFSQPFWSNEGILKEVTRAIPMGRIAETGDVVGAVLFLTSDLSDFITGEIINVDGGAMSV